MTVCLRPHHLLCMLTFSGDGYSDAFTVNLDAIVARIGAGEDVLILSGPDDICAPLRDAPDAHCLNESVRVRDALAARDLGRLLGIEISEGARLTLGPEQLRQLRRAFVNGDVRQACEGCEWHALCTAVARRGFCDAKLGPAV